MSTSLKIPSLAPFLFYNFNNMFVGVLSEMLREKYVGDIVNFSYDSLLDVRNFFYKLTLKRKNFLFY